MTRATLAAGVEDFPRRQARTRRFTLGAPRDVRVAADGDRIVFLRSRAGDDPSTGLWLWTPDGGERELAHAEDLGASEEALGTAERARRERVRESAGGIVAFSTDADVHAVCFAVAGDIYLADLESGAVQRLPVTEHAFSPQISPDGRYVAYTADEGLCVADVGAVRSSVLAGNPSPDVTWGEAEFVAAEEMGRTRGFWWSPDGRHLLVTRVDVTDVARWHIADPTDPARAPQVVRYPAAGTPNARVSLHVVPLDGSKQRSLDHDAAAFPYLVDAEWSAEGGLVVVVQTPDQRTLRVLRFDPETGDAEAVEEQHDLHWTDVVAGTPAWTPASELVCTRLVDDTRVLVVGGRIRTPAGLQVRAVAGVADGAVWFTASGDDPAAVVVHRLGLDDDRARPVSDPHGVAGVSVGGATQVLRQARPDRPGTVVTVHHGGSGSTLTSAALEPGLALRVERLVLGKRRLQAALLRPVGWQPENGPLPVLLDPYGGPGAQRVLAAHGAYCTSQWFAEHGFAVLVVDGRGTPGRGPAWERTVAGDLSTAPLTDQLDALAAAADEVDGLDTTRVAIRGWSFGGYLAALAVLRRSDLVHAAIAGAPVTDWSLYDTHYTERYLGTPAGEPDAYRRSSLLDEAAGLDRPLLIIHGLADDNVVVAHSLRLSRALLEAGRPHRVLPLSQVTHMTPQEDVAENLLRLQLDFLTEALHLSDDV